MRRVAILASAAAIAVSAPVLAQSMPGMDHSSMPDMKMPAAKPTAKPAAKPRAPTARPATVTRKPATVRGIQRQNRAAEVPAKSASAPVAGNDTGKPAAMPGMDMPDTPATATDASCPPEHAKMGHCTPKAATAVKPSDGAMAGMDMPGGPAAVVDPDCPPEHAKMGHCTPKPVDASGVPLVGTSLPAGKAPAPAPPTDNYADRFFPPSEMARARHEMHADQGAQKFGYIVFNLAEYQPRRGRDGFRWDGEAWYGGDINRLTLKTEGEGRFGEGVETAEIQALYSRAVDPYFNLQAGVRQDLGKGPRRTYATVGFEGLAPYWFEVEGALFLSDKGDVLGRLDGYYDQRITQRLILQPRAELNFAAQDIPANGIGAGLSSAELGLRLRYEIVREFAPYIGVSWERKVGASARYARAAGEDPTSAGLVAGIRFWF